MSETEGPRNEDLVAGAEGPRDKDLIAELADLGERTLRRIVGYPRRVVAEARERLGGRLDDAATKLRSIDPLDRRVAELEKRLDSLEASEQPASTRAKPVSPRTASKASARAGSKQVESDPAPPGDETTA